jgi:SAM-dependent methyltransferase
MTRPPELFDMRLRSMRRDRAARTGPELFLHERAFADILERLGHVNRRLEKALLVGAANADWANSLAQLVGSVEVAEQEKEDELDREPGSFDVIVAIGTLDTVNDLPGALLHLRFLLKPDSLLIGAMSGGDTLPRLRRAMRAADAVMGAAAPHVHPRIEPAALAQLLLSAGFAMPVVDVDRIQASYPSLRKLVADLRAMGATNLLSQRSRTPLTHAAMQAAEGDFSIGQVDGRTVETFEVLHFAAWSPAQQP